MIFSNLTSRKYLKCLMVAEYKLNSESNVKTVYLCQNVILASNLRSPSAKCPQSKGEGSCLQWDICMLPRCTWKCFTLGSSCWRRHSVGNLQYIFLRCLIVKTLHFLNLPICQSLVKRWIHSSKFWKNYWPFRIMNKKGNRKGGWEQKIEVSWFFTSEV